MVAPNLAKITDFVDRMKAKVLQQYKDPETHPVIHALIEALAAEVQELEDASYDVYLKRTIAAAEGIQLDKIGGALKCYRGGADDETYRRRIYIRIAQLNSEGTVEDVISIFMLMTGATRVRIIEGEAYFILEGLINSFSFDFDTALVANAVRAAKSAGVGCDVVVHLDTHFGFQGDPFALGYGDLSDPTVGGHYADII